MSSREWPDRVRDILDAIAETQYFINRMSLDDFKADTRTVKAVELNFIMAILDSIARAAPGARRIHLTDHIGFV